MDIVQVVMLATAGAVVFMIYKQIDSGNFQQIHKDRDDAAPQQPSNTAIKDKSTPDQDDAAMQKQRRVDELLEKTDQLVSDGNFTEAQKSIEAALILQQNSDNYMRQGFILKNLHEYAGAIESFKEVVAQDTQNDMAYLFLGEIYTIKKEYEKAQEVFEAALKIDNEFDKTHVEYAKMLIKIEDFENATLHLNKALEIDAENEEAQELLNNLKEVDVDEKN